MLIKSIKFKLKYGGEIQVPHLRLGWRWSQVGDPKLRYKWAASKLLEMKSFMEKSKRFDDAPGVAGRKYES